MAEVLKRQFTRRTMLRIGGCAGVTAAACGISGVVVATQTDLLDRIRGISDTPVLEDREAWTYAGSTLTLALDRIPDLAVPGSAVRLEDDDVPEPLLIVHGVDDEYYVFINKCPHAGRKIDPLGGKLECTSIGKSVFDYAGNVLSGTAKTGLTTYTVTYDAGQLVVELA